MTEKEPIPTARIKSRKPIRHRGIRRRGNRWAVDTRYRGIYIWETCSTLEMAQAALRKAQKDIDEGRFLDKPKDPKWTFGKLCSEYLAHCEKNRLKSIQNVRSMVSILEGHFGKDTNLKNINKKSIQAWKDNYTPTSHSEKGGAVAVNRMLGVLRRMFQLAVEKEEISANPVLGIRPSKEGPGRNRFLEQGEVERLLNACAPAIRPIVELAILTGMRKSEILGLRKDQVLLKEKILLLPDPKSGEPEAVTLPDRAVDILKKVMANRSGPLLFPGKTGKPMDIKRQWKNALRKSGIKDFHFHDLRHTCASWLIMTGSDLRTVQDQLRHKSPSMTSRYSHLSRAHKKAAVENLSKKLFPE